MVDELVLQFRDLLNSNNENGNICFNLTNDYFIEISRFGKSYANKILVLHKMTNQLFLIDHSGVVGWYVHNEPDGIEYNSYVSVQKIKFIDLLNDKCFIEFKNCDKITEIDFTHA